MWRASSPSTADAGQLASSRVQATSRMILWVAEQPGDTGAYANQSGFFCGTESGGAPFPDGAGAGCLRGR